MSTCNYTAEVEYAYACKTTKLRQSTQMCTCRHTTEAVQNKNEKCEHSALYSNLFSIEKHRQSTNAHMQIHNWSRVRVRLQNKKQKMRVFLLVFKLIFDWGTWAEYTNAHMQIHSWGRVLVPLQTKTRNTSIPPCTWTNLRLRNRGNVHNCAHANTQMRQSMHTPAKRRKKSSIPPCI